MSQQLPFVSYASYPYPYTDAAYPSAAYPSAAYPYQVQQQQMVPQQPSGSVIPGAPGQPFVEESYIENILRLNLGKIITVYQTFENNTQWNAKIFRGRLEAAGRDHIILSDPQTGRRYLLLMVNTDYITTDEELNYVAPPLPPGIR
jgi:spore germination protein Q